MTKNFKFLSIFLFSLIILSSCKKEVYEVFEEPKTILDVAYGNDAAQKADIFLPANRSEADTRVLVIIHGGGWMAGDKKDMQSFVPKFQAELKDYAIVNMNYRLADLTSRYMLPMQTDDIQSVINHMKNNAAEYGIKPEFVVLGLSAGGHLAMYYAYKNDSDRKVKAVVNIVGPSNLNDTYYLNNVVFNFAMGRITAPSNLPSGMPQSVLGSPVTWISTKSQPTISFYGTTDTYIPASQHSALEQELNKVNVPNEKHIYEGGHVVGFSQSDDIVNKTKEFLRKNVR